MKYHVLFILMILCKLQSMAQVQPNYRPNHPYIQYFGRIDKSPAMAYRFWQPGVYIKAKFRGTYCYVIMGDEELNGQHNYVAIQIDEQPPVRIQTSGAFNLIKVASNLSDAEHIITICKNTESGIGYLDFQGLVCPTLLPMPSKPTRRIEFIGNSITCGADSDTSGFSCGKGNWYDQHNAYMSYGPTTARNLDAQWQLSAVSGIGLIHSCCDMTITMPKIFDKVNMRSDSINWDFGKYKPHVVTVCLGQNDGKQDSTAFCNAYLQFISSLRTYYPNADIILLSSPMADEALNKVLKSYIKSVVAKSGDQHVSYYFYSRRYNSGCFNHPSLAEHQLIAAELTAYIRQLENW